MKKRYATSLILMFVLAAAGCAKPVGTGSSGDADQSKSPVAEQLTQTVQGALNFADVNQSTFPVPYTEDPVGVGGPTWRGILTPFLGGRPGFPGIAALVDPEGVFTPSEESRDPKAGNSIAQCQDGTSNTIVFVELADPKSERSCITEEEFFDQLQNCPADKPGYYVAMMSAQVFLLDKSVTREQLHALVTMKGGDKVPTEVLK